MNSFKQDVIIYKVYPGLSHRDILKMPYYEYRLKVDCMKELADKENEGSQAQTNAYKEQMNDMTSNMKMPEMPKMPDIGSIPKISMPSLKF